MDYNQLGKSGLMVSEACLGTMIFGEDGQRGTDEKKAIKMIHQYLDAGGNFIDTADVYADGRSEIIVGKALREKKRENVIVASKVRFATGEGPNQQGLSRKHIIEGCEASLKRLGLDTIDLYYVHMWDPITPIEETMEALDGLVKAGKIRYLGVSNFMAWQVMKALGICRLHNLSLFIAGQYQYSLVERNIEREYFSMFEEEGIGLVPWGPLGGGFLSGKYKKGERPTDGRIAVMPHYAEEAWQRRNQGRNWRILDRVGEIAEKRGKTYPQVALNWLRQKDVVTSIIIGARTPEQLEDNLQAFNWDLSKEEMRILDKASRIEEIYPYRMIKEYGQR